MKFPFSALLPHPPIIVPAVGGARLADCAATVEACRRVARELVSRRPDRLVLVSPHSPRRASTFSIAMGPRLRGDLGRFGAPEASVDLPLDQSFADGLAKGRGGSGQKLPGQFPADGLDHGAVVPLWFLAEAGWRGPTVLLSLPETSTPEMLWNVGSKLRSSAAAAAGSTAFVASGDMSHRCLPGAPAGFHPRAVEFDRQLTELIADQKYRAIPSIEPTLRTAAAEDTTESVMIVTAATAFASEGGRVLSYEHPFGVGYLVAILHDPPQAA